MTEMSKEYGTALFFLACENGQKEAYADALGRISLVLRENPEYVDFLASPSIPLSERLDAVEKAFAGSVPEYVLNFLQLLCEKGRIRSFDGCVKEYRSLLAASAGVSTAKVVSAVQLTAAEEKRLKEKLGAMCGHIVEIECSVDPTLLGGLTIEMDGKVMDGSLRRRFREVKDVLYK